MPFARFAAQHISQLGTPFKRYHIGPVWRGENTQKGRYREFWQCDFDTIGTTSNAADIEVVLGHPRSHARVLPPSPSGRGEGGEGRFVIHVNNRLVLNGLLEHLGLADKAVPLLRSLDKLPKIGRDKVVEEMVLEAKISTDKASDVVKMVQITEQGGDDANQKALNELYQFFGTTPNAKAEDGLRRLSELLAVADKAGIPSDRIMIDLSICRGLDYYTGTVYETFLTDLPKIGSVCSGGRYDNLAGLYTKQSLPGVGASLGLDRLLAALEELKLLKSTTTPAPVFIVQFTAERIGDYQRMARTLRALGIGVEVFPDAKKIGQQFQYAEKRGHKIALIAGPDDFAAGTWNVKDLAKARREERCAGRGGGGIGAIAIEMRYADVNRIAVEHQEVIGSTVLVLRTGRRGLRIYQLGMSRHQFLDLGNRWRVCRLCNPCDSDSVLLARPGDHGGLAQEPTKARMFWSGRGSYRFCDPIFPCPCHGLCRERVLR